MSLPDWATTASGVLAVLASFWAIHRFTTKALIRDYLSELETQWWFKRKR
jgi:CHAT domain-containing protein